MKNNYRMLMNDRLYNRSANRYARERKPVIQIKKPTTITYKEFKDIVLDRFDDIETAYNHYRNVSAFAKAYNVSRYAVTRLMKECGYRPTSHIRSDSIHSKIKSKELFIEIYYSFNGNYKKICEYYSISKSSLYQYMKSINFKPIYSKLNKCYAEVI